VQRPSLQLLRARAHRRGRRFQPYTTPQGFGASDLQTAYNIDPSVDPGATVAIIGAYGYPNLASDLATYRSTMGLPACTVASGCLKIVNQSGQTSPLPSGPQNGWDQENALDVDMVSAACPKCKILMVQADDDQGDGLLIANSTAVALGATVVSNSWGAPENQFGDVTTEESYFNHAGVAIFVSTGDDGYNDGGQGPDYPATSAYVIGVGGTSLAASGSARGWTESAWRSGGSACSQGITKPTWQTSTACTKRMTSDVAAVGDPNTGVAVYNRDGGGWQVIGGTSASSPLVASIFALTKHGNITAQ
jgi:subtilase family serine protease